MSEFCAWAVKLTSLHTLELAELAPGAATLSTPLVQSLATRGGTAAGGAQPEGPVRR